MDIESTSEKNHLSLPKAASPGIAKPGETSDVGDDDPYSWNGPSNALLGLVMAVASIGVPLSVILIESPSANDNNVSSALESYGSKSFNSLPLSRFSKPSG